MKTELLSVLH